jgi:phosphoglycolate phosphatase
MSAELPHLIFDLDGTLVDGAGVFVGIVNEMLRERGSERAMTVADARPFLSLGGPALVSGLLGDECGDVVREVADFRERYASHVMPGDSVYDGVRTGLHELADHGFTLAICSNKPEYLCEKVLGDLGLAQLFSAIVGSMPGLQSKPAPDLMNRVFGKLECDSSGAILIGDSEVDHALAENTGVPFLFVNYGYAAEGWDSSNLNRFDRFADVVGWLTSRYPAAPVRHVA